MACPKCKSIYVTRVVKENKPGKSYELTHVCRNCGSTDDFCCAIKADGSATKGMEKDKNKAE